MKRLSKKLRVSRTTLRNLTRSGMHQAQGGLLNNPLSHTCKPSVFDSCYDTDCCLMRP